MGGSTEWYRGAYRGVEVHSQGTYFRGRFALKKGTWGVERQILAKIFNTMSLSNPCKLDTRMHRPKVFPELLWQKKVTR